MSNIGKKIINVPDSVSILIDSGSITVKGSLGELKQYILEDIIIDFNNSQIQVKRSNDSKSNKEKHGLMRALVQNMVTGVSEGFKKELLIEGVGYNADASNNVFLLLNIGFSHPIYFQIPEGIKIETPNNTTIIISGIDKQLVGEIASKIRSYRKPEPYKGKGIRYSDETIRRKAGKTVGAV